MLHSKVARFSDEQAARTSRTARISSAVSITTMGVDELSRIFRRSRVSGIGFNQLLQALVVNQSE